MVNAYSSIVDWSSSLRGTALGAAAVIAMLAIGGCAAAQSPSPGPKSPSPSIPAAPSPTPTVGPVTPTASGAAGGFDFGSPEVMADGLDVPWALAFLPGGDAIVTERDTGRLLRIRRGEPPVEVARVDAATAEGEVGLLGLAANPAAAGDLYVYFGTPDDNRIARIRAGGPPEVILSGIPGAPFHTGGRLAFGPDGKLYASVGDATLAANAQEPDSLAGKILRLEADGSIPADNPDPASAVWSLGHRNVEGLAWDASDRLWATEFGEDRLDELNLIEPGGNYGWPVFEGPGNDPRYVDPVLTWTPAEASPAGIAFAGGSLYVAALRGTRLWQIPMDEEGRLGAPEALLDGTYGRIRIVELGPDGWLWIGTSNRDERGGPPGPDDDRIVRFPPLAAAP